MLVEKNNVRREAKKVFGKSYARCPHCKRGRLWSWDNACKVCGAKVVR